jgi:hypothetical protein
MPLLDSDHARAGSSIRRFKYAVLLVVILTSSQPARAGGSEHVDLVALGSVLIEIDLPVSHSVTQSQLATPPGFKGAGKPGRPCGDGRPY